MIFRYNITETITVKDFLIKEKIPSNVITSLKSSNGQILVNDQSVSTIYTMKDGDLLEVVFPQSEQGDNITSVKGDFEILYEDSYLLIINKENNLVNENASLGILLYNKKRRKMLELKYVVENTELVKNDIKYTIVKELNEVIRRSKGLK